MKKPIILPLDGYGTSSLLLSALDKILKEPDLKDYLAYIKLNDGFHNPDAGGPQTKLGIEKILEENDCDARVFVDMKICDVSATMINVLKKYNLRDNDILTVGSNCSTSGILELRRKFPQIKLAMVCALTDIGEEEFQRRFGMSPELKIYNDLMNIRSEYAKIGNINDCDEPFDLVVSSYHELEFLTTNLPRSYEYIVPGIRDEWMNKSNKADEHQKRIAGVGEALEAGATFVVMGAQMTKGNPEMGITAAESRERTIMIIEKFAANNYEGMSPLEILEVREGYYHSPTKENGTIIGPLVGYAGTYKDNEEDKNFVGVEYFNFARAEDDSWSRNEIASVIFENFLHLPDDFDFNLLIGAPMGGIMLATTLSDITGCRAIFAEKKITALADPTNNIKEKSILVIDRHEIYPNDKVMIVEDICNNFSTTEQLAKLIEQTGAKLIGIMCAFNRSGKTEWNGVPVICAQEVPAKQWRQEEPEVSQLIAAKNVVWKPKKEWPKLKAAMNADAE